LLAGLGCYILPIILILKQIIILLGLNMTRSFDHLLVTTFNPLRRVFFGLQELPVLICGNLYKPILGFLCAIFARNVGIKKPMTHQGNRL
jgi:hypothetical protein